MYFITCNRLESDYLGWHPLSLPCLMSCAMQRGHVRTSEPRLQSKGCIIVVSTGSNTQKTWEHCVFRGPLLLLNILQHRIANHNLRSLFSILYLTLISIMLYFGTIFGSSGIDLLWHCHFYGY